jgi:hypothetical protein
MSSGVRFEDCAKECILVEMSPVKIIVANIMTAVELCDEDLMLHCPGPISFQD